MIDLAFPFDADVIECSEARVSTTVALVGSGYTRRAVPQGSVEFDAQVLVGAPLVELPAEWRGRTLTLCSAERWHAPEAAGTTLSDALESWRWLSQAMHDLGLRRLNWTPELSDRVNEIINDHEYGPLRAADEAGALLRLIMVWPNRSWSELHPGTGIWQLYLSTLMQRSGWPGAAQRLGRAQTTAWDEDISRMVKHTQLLGGAALGGLSAEARGRLIDQAQAQPLPSLVRWSELGQARPESEASLRVGSFTAEDDPAGSTSLLIDTGIDSRWLWMSVNSALRARPSLQAQSQLALAGALVCGAWRAVAPGEMRDALAFWTAPAGQDLELRVPESDQHTLIKHALTGPLRAARDWAGPQGALEVWLSGRWQRAEALDSE